MDCKTINMSPIREYLAGLNIYPAKERGYYGMYHSPFREDQHASMKVDYNKNLWIDYGTREGGTLIDLVMRIKNVAFSEAVALLSRHNNITSQRPDSFSFHGNRALSRKEIESEPTIQITKVATIISPQLLSYLEERKINLEIAKIYCREISYTVNGKPYFAIGFRNNSNAWVLRNKHFKGCTAMDISSMLHSGKIKNICLLFEGFTDFLSYLTLKGEKAPTQDTIILNSVINLSKAEKELSTYRTIYAFMDNDESGKRAVQYLRSVCNKVIDQSTHYANENDLNDYLCRRSIPKQAIKKMPSRGFKR